MEIGTFGEESGQNDSELSDTICREILRKPRAVNSFEESLILTRSFRFFDEAEEKFAQGGAYPQVTRRPANCRVVSIIDRNFVISLSKLCSIISRRRR